MYCRLCFKYCKIGKEQCTLQDRQVQYKRLIKILKGVKDDKRKNKEKL